jgi:uncharacterized membrane protein
MHGILFATVLAAALGAGVVGGVFFAFSSFVMPALARLPARDGITAMQSINVVVLNRSFLGVFLGTGALAAALLLAVPWHGRASLAVAAALYLVGSVGVTMLCNVPRNERLAVVVPGEPESDRLWTDYVRDWSRWNTVRAAASVAAAAAFVVALVG